MTESARIPRGRQPGLFQLENPLTQRFGRDYFAALPQEPGVYFFSDDSQRLLYIGQSANLRARIGSYRQVTPDRHPRRTLRLVARIRGIAWETCGNAAAAIERERVLLLERRPPFNRAGVWQGAPWWLTVTRGADGLRVALSREPEDGIGPLPPSFRYVYGSLARCICRAALPELPVHLYPHGLMKVPVPLSFRLPLPHAELDTAWRSFTAGAVGQTAELLERLDALPPSASATEAAFWLEEREQLAAYGRRSGKARSAGGAGNPESLQS